MASCLFASPIGDEQSCGQSLYYLSSAACITLIKCDKDVSQHLNSVKVYGEETINSEMKLILARADLSFSWLTEKFSAGAFKTAGGPAQLPTSQPKKSAAEERLDKPAAAVYSCPGDGCMRVFQRYCALERHLSYEKCTKSLERGTLLDQAKGYAAKLFEGVGTTLTLSEVTTTSPAKSPLTEGWALKVAKKPYRFNETQKAYLMAKFNIGQETGQKMDADVVAKEMRRARGSNGERLFKVSEFLTPLQVSSFFSRVSAKVRQQPIGRTTDPVTEEDARAATEEENFAHARESVLASLQLSHPIVCDEYDISAMSKADSLGKQKLGLLQLLCTKLELKVPVPPQRKKTTYVALLDEAVKECGCKKSD